MSPEWLLHDGVLIPTSLVLSHHEQLDRLRGLCPAAVDSAVVAGDPCFDRLLASVPLRAAYRSAFGAPGDQKLVLISSTWGRRSLYGQLPDLVRRMRARLPLDEYQVLLALHPNVWYGHSRWQVRMWLAECERAGVVILPADEGWRAGVVASDVVVGDYGSVTFYAAALGRPVLLATWPHGEVDPASPIGRFLAKADRLDPRRTLPSQLDDALRAGENSEISEITALVSSAPGDSARLLRAELYRWLRLPQPDDDPPTYLVPVPTVPPIRCAAQVVRAHVTDDDAAVGLTRYPAELVDSPSGWPSDAHLVVTCDEPRADLVQGADIVINERPGDARAWIADTLAALPGAVLASMPAGPGQWLVGGRDGTLVEFTSAALDGRIWASVVHAWLGSERFPDRATVTLGGHSYQATVRQLRS